MGHQVPCWFEQVKDLMRDDPSDLRRINRDHYRLSEIIKLSDQPARIPQPQNSFNLNLEHEKNILLISERHVDIDRM